MTESVSYNLIMISIKYGDVPSYLHNSDFYDSLTCENPNEEFQVPTKCFAHDESVESAEQFLTMLQVIAFWGLRMVPVGFFRFGCKVPKSELLSLLGAADVEIKLAQDLQDIFTEGSQQYLKRAMVTGRHEVVATVVEYKLETLTEDVASTAAELGQLGHLKLLVQNECPLVKAAGAKSAAEKAASGGHLDCLKYLRELGCEWDKYLLVVAAKGGHVNILEYAHSRGLTWTPDESFAMPTRFDLINLTPLVAAVRGGHLECVRYLLDSGAALEPKFSAIACEHGHLHILKLFHERGAIWEEGVCFFAIAHNQFECLQYLMENDCPWSEEASTHAARNGQLTMLAYVVENGNPCTAETLLAAVSTKEDSFAIVQYLIEGKHVPLSSEVSFMHIAFLLGVLVGSAAIVKYLAAQPGCAMNTHYDRGDELIQQFNMTTFEKMSREDFAAYDANLVNSISAAVEVGWDIRAHGAGVVRLVSFLDHVLPKSKEYLIANKYL